ncbi:unnamed protein product [Notodromas monacha]|uniref:EMI domain-containing protein n=1 Tax=Notodromas monacha TaxID=399045 RepID=A0A7R9BTT1_9CRUS|nr:unnamed protein product [Notodromas monacha]CAG0920227.1 unnamed protein product [Notodromas monacha]
MMMRDIELVMLVLTGVVVTCFLIGETSAELKGANVCTKQETYVDTVKVSYHKPYQVRTHTWCLAVPPRCTKYKIAYKIGYRNEVSYHKPYQVRTHTWCLAVPPRCTKYKIAYKIGYRNEAVKKTRTVSVCCKGYAEAADGESCIPICSNDCIHGVCESPEKCKCLPGFGGPTCSISSNSSSDRNDFRVLGNLDIVDDDDHSEKTLTGINVNVTIDIFSTLFRKRGNVSTPIRRRIVENYHGDNFAIRFDSKNDCDSSMCENSGNTVIDDGKVGSGNDGTRKEFSRGSDEITTTTTTKFHIFDVVSPIKPDSGNSRVRLRNETREQPPLFVVDVAKRTCDASRKPSSTKFKVFNVVASSNLSGTGEPGKPRALMENNQVRLRNGTRKPLFASLTNVITNKLQTFDVGSRATDDDENPKPEKNSLNEANRSQFSGLESGKNGTRRRPLTQFSGLESGKNGTRDLFFLADVARPKNDAAVDTDPSALYSSTRKPAKPDLGTRNNYGLIDVRSGVRRDGAKMGQAKGRWREGNNKNNGFSGKILGESEGRWNNSELEARLWPEIV